MIYSSTVTVEENTPPSVSTPTVSGLASGWVGPATTVSYAGSDQLGLRSVGLVEGNKAVATTANTHCVDWSVLPCSEPSAGGSVGLGGSAGTSALAALGDGTHQIQARAVDGAGNVSVSPAVAVQVDTTPPVATNLTGGGLSAETYRVLDWTLPTGGSPLASATVTTCVLSANAPEVCTDQGSTLPGGVPIAVYDPAGTVRARVTLTDVAGNVGVSDWAEFRRDAVLPVAPTLTLVGTNGAYRGIRVDVGDPGDRVLLPRLCTAAGCNDLPSQTNTGNYVVALPAPGSYRLEVALRDDAGNVGPYGAIPLELAPPPTPTPTPTPPATKRSAKLKVTFPKKLGPTSVAISGSVVAGSATKVTVKLAGKTTRGRSTTRTGSVKPFRSGRFSVRVKLPAGASRTRAVVVTVTATPSAGFKVTPTHKTLRH
ncbi:MAG: hypothetical protein AAGC46_11855 [Solirubrobacteraceae bacterium]|nr:hypothetical protein [Patulibacter sp.]